MVVLYHSKLFPVAAGHLGIDIFFVISGFLITRLVAREIEEGTFSLSGFYFRRAKRLLPAAYTTFLATAIASVFILDTQELRGFVPQLLGALTFTSNFVLWSQTGYFEGSATVKPLLHIWSLSIEEQYYLLLPAAMLLAPRRWWLPGMGLLFAASLALWILAGPAHPSAAFYLLPTRGWEFALGSLGALGRGFGSTRLLAGLFWLAVLALLAVPFAPPFAPGDGLNAVIVCVATLLIIVRRHEAADSNRAVRAFARIGDFSYSLYLVHWPLFALSNNLYMGEVPFWIRIACFAMSLLLGYLLHVTIERPLWLRQARPSAAAVRAMAAASLAVLLAPAAALAAAISSDRDYPQIRRVNYGLSVLCEYREDFAPRAECRTSSSPRFLIWGDSFAMHLVPGVVSTTGEGVEQATRSECGPLEGISPTVDGPLNEVRAGECIRFNESVLRYLATSPSIDVIVLSSPFAYYLSGRIWRASGSGIVHDAASERLALEAMRGTIARVRVLGKRVVVVAPPPIPGWDIGRCLQRMAEAKPILGVNEECKVPVLDYLRFQAPVHAFLASVARELDVDVVSFDQVLCGARVCETVLDGKFVYRDRGHFAHEGIPVVAKRMDLAGRLMRHAR